MTTEQLKQFLSEKPCLNKSCIARQAGISLSYLQLILRGKRPLTTTAASKLLKVLIEYGYQQEEDGTD